MSAIKNTQKILEKINLLMEEYAQNPSLIAIDILQEKTRTFYEELNALKENTDSQKASEQIIKETVIKETPKKELKEQTTVEKKVEEKPQEKQPEIKKEPTPIVEQEKTMPTPKKEAKKQEIIAPKKSEQKTEKKVNLQEPKETIADSFTPQKSMNDLLSEIKQNTDLATQLQNRPIQDLKNAISLNDKIWFIKELFSGDADKYNSVIENISKANSADEAIQIIEPFSWDKEEDSTKRFIELIYRKFVQ